MTPPSQPHLNRAPRHKTRAALLATLGGWLGLHRFYLKGWDDVWGWCFPIPSALGLWGVERVQQLGQDDLLSWLLIPWLGLSVSVGCLMGLIYALTPEERWNERHNPQSTPTSPTVGATTGWTVLVLITALMLGATAFMSTLAFSFQRFFEYQVLTQETAPSTQK